MSVPGRRKTGGEPVDPAIELGPIKSTRIYEEIVRQVKQLIAEGRLKSGDRLPPERELAEKFVVSRTSVREALRALESLGLIEIRAGEGTFVRQVSVDALVGPLALMMTSQREAIGELFEARRVLEPAIVALAAIGAAAHNRAITRIVHAIMDLLTQSREESLNTPGRPTRSHQDHRRILQAIAKRNPSAARQAMLDHIVAV